MGLVEVILKEVISGNIETILLLLPLIIIGLGILYIILNYIKKNLGWFKGKFKTKKKIEREEKKVNYSQELKKINKDDVDEALSKINVLIDQFFIDNFKLDHSYTYQELIREFEKRKKTDLKIFFDDLLEIQYTKEQVSKKELDRIIRDFSKIIHKYGSRRKRVKQTTVSWMDGFGNKLIEKLRYKPKEKEEIVESEGLFDALKKLKKKYDKVKEENIKLKILEKRKEEERKKRGAIAKRRKEEEEKKEGEREKRRKRERLKKDVHEFLFGFIDKYKKRRIEERRLKAIRKAAEEKRKKKEAEERRREGLAKKRREKIEKGEREEEKRRKKVERKRKIKEIEHKLKNIFISSRKKEEKVDILTRISNYLSKIQEKKYRERKRREELNERRKLEELRRKVERKRRIRIIKKKAINYFLNYIKEYKDRKREEKRLKYIRKAAEEKRKKREVERKRKDEEGRKKRERLKKDVHEFLFGFIDKYKKRRIEERRLKAIRKAAEGERRGKTKEIKERFSKFYKVIENYKRRGIRQTDQDKKKIENFSLNLLRKFKIIETKGEKERDESRRKKRQERLKKKVEDVINNWIKRYEKWKEKRRINIKKREIERKKIERLEEKQKIKREEESLLDKIKEFRIKKKDAKEKKKELKEIKEKIDEDQRKILSFKKIKSEAELDKERLFFLKEKISGPIIEKLRGGRQELEERKDRVKKDSEELKRREGELNREEYIGIEERRLIDEERILQEKKDELNREVRKKGEELVKLKEYVGNEENKLEEKKKKTEISIRGVQNKLERGKKELDNGCSILKQKEEEFGKEKILREEEKKILEKEIILQEEKDKLYRERGKGGIFNSLGRGTKRLLQDSKLVKIDEELRKKADEIESLRNKILEKGEDVEEVKRLLEDIVGKAEDELRNIKNKIEVGIKELSKKESEFKNNKRVQQLKKEIEEREEKLKIEKQKLEGKRRKQGFFENLIKDLDMGKFNEEIKKKQQEVEDLKKKILQEKDELKERRLDISKEVEEEEIKDVEREEIDIINREKEFGKQRGLFDDEIRKLRERLNLMRNEERRLGKVKDIKKEERILKKKIDLKKSKSLFSIFKWKENKEIKRIKKLIKEGEEELKTNVYSAKLVSSLIGERYDNLSEKDKEGIKGEIGKFNEKLNKKIKYHETNRMVLQLEFALKNNDKLDARMLYQRIRKEYGELEGGDKKDIYNKMTKLLGR